MVQIYCPETPVRNYHCAQSNNPEERRSDVLYIAEDAWSKKLKMATASYVDLIRLRPSSEAGNTEICGDIVSRRTQLYDV